MVQRGSQRENGRSQKFLNLTWQDITWNSFPKIVEYVVTRLLTLIRKHDAVSIFSSLVSVVKSKRRNEEATKGK